MSNAERFLAAYAIAEERLNKILKSKSDIPEEEYVPFSKLIYKCASINKIVSVNQQSLRDYNELRNAIVHKRGTENEVLAEPSDAVTTDMERIAQLLQLDDSIMNFVSKPVEIVTLQSSLQEVYEKMKKLKTSKIPVYDNHQFAGLITLESICDWAMQGQKNAIVKEYIEENKSDRVLFLKKTSSVQNAIHGFENSVQNGATLLAVIVSETGSSSEEPLGIITTADMPKILNSII